MAILVIRIIFTVFQLTSSRRGWPDCSQRWRHKLYFNSHPHEEDDKLAGYVASDNYISTHILTKRMTMAHDFDLYAGWISTHILTKRMTNTHSETSTIAFLFQLTSSRRGWRIFSKIPAWTECISTHILTKRMTFLSPHFFHHTCIFQLTSSRRGWQQF